MKQDHFTGKLRKAGGSVVVTIPEPLTHTYKAGDMVDVYLERRPKK